MLNLISKIQSKSIGEKIKHNSIASVLFYQTEKCADLVAEVFRFEGDEHALTIRENHDQDIYEYVRESSVEIVIIELNLSENVTNEIERIGCHIPNEAAVIVIGSEDAISTVRNLKSMGFYYVFWPITKQELVDFIRHVISNRNRNMGLCKERVAKRLGVWGTKGGVGTTFITAQIAHGLAHFENSTSLLVDQDFVSSDIDIYLGLSNHERKRITRASLTLKVDADYALNFVRHVDHTLSLLSLESDDLNELELKEYSRTLTTELMGKFNFILEDLSKGSNIKHDVVHIIDNYDILILLIEPTVSSLREATRIMGHLTTECRLLIVVNHARGAKGSSIKLSDVKQFLGREPDVVIPYEPRLEQFILDGKHVYEDDIGVSSSLKKLTCQLLGQDDNKNNIPLLNRLWSIVSNGLN